MPVHFTYSHCFLSLTVNLALADKDVPGLARDGRLCDGQARAEERVLTRMLWYAIPSVSIPDTDPANGVTSRRLVA
jgi:hypothetical protein